MKKLIFLFCLLGCLSVLYAGEIVDVPLTILQAFNAEHTLVKKSSWGYSRGIFRVEYRLFGDRRLYKTKYDAAGELVERQTEVDYAEVTANAKTEIEKNFKRFVPVLCMKLTGVGKEPGYKITLERWSFGHVFKEIYKVIFSTDGRLLETSRVELEMAEPIAQSTSTAY